MAHGGDPIETSRNGAPARAGGRFVIWIVARCGFVAGWTLLSGCALPFMDHHRQPVAPLPMVTNPLLVPQQDAQFVWRQIADSVDDDFQIAKEEPLRVVDGILTEGTLETYPLVGSTLLEPWRADSTPGYEKMFATLQSIRRRVVVCARPATGGYEIEVQVHTELENLPQPENTTFSRELIIPENAIGEPTQPNLGVPSGIRGWIPKGRDRSLETALLLDMRQRLTVNGGQPAGPQ